jgi:hypothetical protein
MQDLQYWRNALGQAEQELTAATRRSDVNAAARRLMRVKVELRLLEREAAKPSGAAAAPASS